MKASDKLTEKDKKNESDQKEEKAQYMKERRAHLDGKAWLCVGAG